MRNIFCFVVLALSSAADAQVPPPPISASQFEIMDVLKSSYKEKSISIYSELLSDDVIVNKDGIIIARSKPEWIRKFGEKLTAAGVNFKVISSYRSSGIILNVEYFNSVASYGEGSGHCCWSFDAVQYHVQGNKISKISILSGGGEQN